jgi:hypothetical protein
MRNRVIALLIMQTDRPFSEECLPSSDIGQKVATHAAKFYASAPSDSGANVTANGHL